MDQFSVHLPAVPIAEQFAEVITQDIANYVAELELVNAPGVMDAFGHARTEMEGQQLIQSMRDEAVSLGDMVAVDGGNNVLNVGGGNQYFAILGRYSARPGFEPVFSMTRLKFESEQGTPMLYGVRNALEVKEVADNNEAESFCIVDNSWIAVLENFNRVLTLYYDERTPDTDREILKSYLAPVLDHNGSFIRAVRNPRNIAMSKASASDKMWERYGEPNGIPQMADKTFLMGILNEGEYTAPIPLRSSTSAQLNVNPWDLFASSKEIKKIYNGTPASNDDCLMTTYFRPHEGGPVKRVEFHRSLLRDNALLFHQMLSTVKESMGIPTIQEPIEQFLVDRIVKSYSGRMPDLYQTVGYANLSRFESMFALNLLQRMRS